MNVDQYEIQSDDDGHIFTFISLGKKEIIKVVRYDKEDFVYTRPDGMVFEAFNLGFGDKKSDSNEIDDLARSNNGDMYIVFNSVLHTIPIFFSKMKKAAIHVRGADKTRHVAYHRFLCQKYDELTIEYEFYGSLDRMIHSFKKGTIYDYIVVLSKMS